MNPRAATPAAPRVVPAGVFGAASRAGLAVRRGRRRAKAGRWLWPGVAAAQRGLADVQGVACEFCGGARRLGRNARRRPHHPLAAPERLGGQRQAAPGAACDF